jgi:hypothetical protein
VTDEIVESTPRRDIERGIVGLVSEHGHAIAWAGLWVTAAIHLTDGYLPPLVLLLLVGIYRTRIDSDGTSYEKRRT